MHAVVVRSTFRSQKSKVQKTDRHGALLDIQMPFRVAGQKGAKREGFVACPKTMAGVGYIAEDLQR